MISRSSQNYWPIKQISSPGRTPQLRWWCQHKYIFNYYHILIEMLMRRVVKFALSSAKTEVTKLPKAPTLLSGELENFRFDAQHSRLFDGYTLDELYGSKIGVKHSPAVKAEMRKDTIASILLFVVGFSIIWHLHQLDSQKLKELSSLNDQRLSRQVTLPEGLVNNIKKSYILQEDGM